MKINVIKDLGKNTVQLIYNDKLIHEGEDIPEKVWLELWQARVGARVSLTVIEPEPEPEVKPKAKRAAKEKPSDEE